MKTNLTFVPCRSCAGKGINGKSNGFIYDKSTNTVKECECHICYRELYDLTDRLEKFGIKSPTSVLAYNIDKDYIGTESIKSVEKIKFFLKKFKENDTRFHNVMLYMYGPNGTQKTSIGQYITKEILSTIKVKSSFQNEYYKAMYIQMNELIKELTAIENDNEETKSATYKRILSSDVLVLDESFDKEKVTIYKSGYQIPYLDSFLRRWMNDETKSIVFISNVLPQDIEKNGYSHSIQDFIERKTSLDKSVFYFEDNYAKNKGSYDVDIGLFKEQS